VTRFTVWAPAADRVEVVLGEERLDLWPGPRDGWWECDVPAAVVGTDYAFSLDGGPPRPDPRSRHQPDGVHGPSRVVGPAPTPSQHEVPAQPAWPGQPSSGPWRGRPLAGAVVYELHIGTFTAEGTFDAAIDRLDHLRDLGVDLVEVMPVAAFSGGHGWGYDGVALWAVHEPYGGPDGFRRFIDACHARGMGVLLDVVYNHLGPSGNYLAEFGPYFTDKHQTPWGPAVNLDDAGSDEVRAFLVGNAIYWLRDFQLDGLRLDAAHAFVDTRAVHLLEELSAAVDEFALQAGRAVTLIAESDLNDPRLVLPREAGGLGLHAQWNDDFHHSLHSLLTGEQQGYYADFGSIAALAKTLTGAYFHDGTWSSFRGRSHGRPVDTARILGNRFIVFLQDHDQIGNRALGDRISATLSPGLRRIGAALLLTSPFTPMLFMGEEWGADTPWQFFTDHPDPELGRAVSEGRRREFDRHGWDGQAIPDPQAPETFERSKLDWAELGDTEPDSTESDGTKPDDTEPDDGHRSLLEWYRALIALRHTRPELADSRLAEIAVDFDEAARWLVIRRGRLRVAVNLADHPQPVPLDSAPGKILLGPDDGMRFDDSVGPDGSGALLMPAESVVVVD
jgi:malto-oligosyltrehalose trehalohydrolase